LNLEKILVIAVIIALVMGPTVVALVAMLVLGVRAASRPRSD
jgi:hypothetical protein